MFLKRFLVLGSLFLSCPVFALDINDGYVRGLPPTQSNTAAFFTAANNTDIPWVIDHVSTDVAEQVELHTHTHTNGMMQMRQVESVTVPAKGSVEFRPGSFHLMLIGLKKPLAEGDSVELNFYNQAGDCKTVELPVISVMNEHKHH